MRRKLGWWYYAENALIHSEEISEEATP